MCQLDALCTCRNVVQLRKALTSLPETLDKTYDRILNKIEGDDRHFAFKVLRRLTYSLRPLRLEEIAEVFAVDAKEYPQVDLDKRFEDPRDILEICSSLISVEDVEILSHTDYADTDNDTGIIDTDTSRKDDRWCRAEVRLAHFSVKEYLVSDRIQHGPAIQYGLQDVESNDSIAEECLLYLLHVIQPGFNLPESLTEYPLAEYAAKYWLEHVRFADSTTATARTLVRELFLSKKEMFINWLQIYDPDSPDESPSLNVIHHPERYGPRLYYASLLGLSEVVENLVKSGVDVNARGGSQINALSAAVGSGHIEVVQLLLDNKAVVDAPEGGSALVSALFASHEEIAMLLIANGADVESPRLKRLYSPLRASVMACSPKCIQFIIDSGADVNAELGFRENALISACRFGREEIVQLLLDNDATIYPQTLLAALTKERLLQMLIEHGGDLDQKDIEGKAVCHYASAGGDVKALELLTSRGSNLSAIDKQGRTCLHLASASGSRGDPEVVTVLLKHGFDPNALDRNGWTPLHWAAKQGDAETIAILEDAGAKFNTETIKGWTPAGEKGLETRGICDGCDLVCKPPNTIFGDI